jgi:hypothetical protein
MALNDLTRIPRRFARGTAAEVAAYTGPLAELVVATDTKRVHFQDGVTAGGIPLLRSDEAPDPTASMTFPDRSTAAASAIPPAATAIRLHGYAAPGDGGAALYKRIAAPSPAKAWHFQSADGAWWALAEPVVDVMMFGAKGDGITNDAGAFAAAAEFFGGLGGHIRIPLQRFLIDSNLSLPRNVTVQGPHRVVGSIPTNNLKGVLFINAAATITLEQGAGLAGLFVFRKGMSFPVANASAFAGTAIAANGNDTFVVDCMIAGFNQAYVSAGHYRPKLQNLMLDNNNGIDISQSPDAVYIDDVHCWPFATAEAFWTGVPGAALDRPGRAFYLHDTVDWPRLTNCFSFAYFRGFVLNDVNSARLTNCGADGDPTTVGSVGFEITGASHDAALIACQSAAARSVGIYVGIDAGAHIKIQSCDVWGGAANGIQIVSGDATILGGSVRDKTNGIVVDSAASLVRISFIRFVSNATNINASVVTSNVDIGEHNLFGGTAAGTSTIGASLQIASVASVPVIAIPN